MAENKNNFESLHSFIKLTLFWIEEKKFNLFLKRDIKLEVMTILLKLIITAQGQKLGIFYMDVPGGVYQMKCAWKSHVYLSGTS